MVGLLLSQPGISLPADPIPPAARPAAFSYQGSWTGTFQTVGSQGQMLVFIDASGNLYGSLASGDGGNFAQISGHHRGNTFHLIITPPPGAINPRGGSTPYTVDAVAQPNQSDANRFVVTAPTGTGHFQSYSFERSSSN